MFPFKKQGLSRFAQSRGGNVTMMFALGAPLLMFGIGVAVDFTNATSRQVQAQRRRRRRRRSPR